MVRTTWNKGLTKETDERIKGYPHNDEFKLNLSKRQKGKNNVSKRPEVRKKIGIASANNWKNDEFREKERKSHSINSKQTWSNPIIREKRIFALRKSLLENREERRKLSSINSILFHKNNKEKSLEISKKLNSPESQRKRKATLKLFYQTKEGIKGREKMRKRMKAIRAKQIFPVKDTSIELKIQNFLKQLGADFFTHKYIREIEHGYQCDILIPSLNLIIECDGDYWHKYPTGTEIDHIRTSELLEKGFKVLRLWECEIKKMDLNLFKERLDGI